MLSSDNIMPERKMAHKKVPPVQQAINSGNVVFLLFSHYVFEHLQAPLRSQILGLNPKSLQFLGGHKCTVHAGSPSLRSLQRLRF
jgi:hypothetical protein